MRWEIIRAMLLYLLLVPASLIMSLLNYPLAPLVVLFADDYGWLPGWLSWFQTPDNSLDGDKGWQTEHRWFKGHPLVDKGWRRWVNRFRWLWRNSMHGFEQEVLGFTPAPDFEYSFRGKQTVSNRPICNGLVWRVASNPGGRAAFQFYLVRAWSKKYCLRINLGWKLWQSPTTGKCCQYVVSVNPFMSWD